jgi:hypothetical protein
MTDPKRLLEAGTDLEVAVVAAARLDTPPDDLQRKLHVTLGVGGAALGAGAATTTTTKAAPLLATAAAKFLAGAVLVGAVVLTVGLVERRSVTTSSGAPAGAMAAPPSVSPLVSPSLVSPSPSASFVADPAPAATVPVVDVSALPVAATAAMPPRARATRPTPPASSEERPPAPGLAGELVLLDGARAALAAGDAGATLARLDDHDRQYPGGALAAEALALRIEAHAKAKDTAQVEELVALFAARYPHHPYLNRVRALSQESRRRP